MQGLVHYSDDSPPASPEAGPSRLRNGAVTETPPPIVKSKKGKDVEPVPENLTHTAQSDLPSSHLDRNQFEGMTEDEIFQIATRPDDIDGLNDWGIPPEADPAECSDQLKAKVAQFLRLKYTSDQHINTSLLASSSFANPHIYSKLVEFVDLDERATQFPSNGWLTRQNLEQLIPRYGPKALSEEQKRRQEAKKREQEGRSSIQFAPGRKETKNSRESKGTKRDRAGGWDERDTRRKR